MYSTLVNAISLTFTSSSVYEYQLLVLAFVTKIIFHLLRLWIFIKICIGFEFSEHINFEILFLIGILYMPWWCVIGRCLISLLTCFQEPDYPQWTSGIQGVILSSFFYGYLFTQIPGGKLKYSWSKRLLWNLYMTCLYCLFECLKVGC